MDIILFILGLFFLIRKRYEYVLAIIVLLATTYLQVPLDQKYFNVFFPHNVSDTGLLLYIIFWLKIAIKFGVTKTHPFTKFFNIFFLFIFLSGCYDYYNNVPIGDIIRFFRNWIFLTFIYIVPYIKHDWIINSLKIIFQITAIISCILILQHFTNIDIIDVRFDEGRGTKPPSYSIYCAAICLINIWNYSLLKRSIYFIIFLLPILLNLKLTYAISIFLIYIIYIFFISNISFIQRLTISLLFIIASLGALAFNESFSDRLQNTFQEINTVESKDVSGNFSYRLLHSYERFDYIIQEPMTFLRGIGFISEKNNNKKLFDLGVWNEEKMEVNQFDTGDIAWSILFIRLGIIGTIIYLYMYFKIIKYFLRYKNKKYISYTLSVMLVFLCFASFGNTLITSSDFFIYPILFTNLYFRI